MGLTSCKEVKRILFYSLFFNIIFIFVLTKERINVKLFKELVKAN